MSTDNIPLHWRQTSYIPYLHIDIPGPYFIKGSSKRIFDAKINRNEHLDRERNYTIKRTPYDVNQPNHIAYLRAISRILERLERPVSDGNYDLTTELERTILRAFSEYQLQEKQEFSVYIPCYNIWLYDVEAEILIRYFRFTFENRNTWFRYTFSGQVKRAFMYYQENALPL